jgi:predicted DNA-binding helix-hairpin-helix protein
MNTADRRALVLLLLAVLILAAGWPWPAPRTQTSLYYWADGKLLRSKDSRAGEGIRLVSKMSCADTPPELAAFFHLPLPVSRADQAALMRLPGIGPKLAENIIRYREGHSIARPDDLRKVKGIGPKRLANLTPLICFDANY